MYGIRLYIFLGSLLFPSGLWVRAECYHPDGSIAEDYEACNATNVDGSACCDLKNSACSTEGYCYGSAGYLCRGGCTDPAWKSLNCAQNCVNTARHIFSNLLPCSSGTYTNRFCCSDMDGVDKGCCDHSFILNAGPPFVPSSNVQNESSTSSLRVSSSTSTLQSISTSSSTEASSSIANHSDTSTQSTSPSAHAHSSKNNIIIGVGVGVSLGLLLLLGLGILLYRERQLHTRMENLKREHQIALSKVWHRRPHDGHLVFGTGGSQELQHMQLASGELDSQSRPIYEVEARP